MRRCAFYDRSLVGLGARHLERRARDAKLLSTRQPVHRLTVHDSVRPDSLRATAISRTDGLADGRCCARARPLMWPNELAGVSRKQTPSQMSDLSTQDRQLPADQLPLMPVNQREDDDDDDVVDGPV